MAPIPCLMENQSTHIARGILNHNYTRFTLNPLTRAGGDKLAIHSKMKIQEVGANKDGGGSKSPQISLSSGWICTTTESSSPPVPDPPSPTVLTLGSKVRCWWPWSLLPVSIQQWWKNTTTGSCHQPVVISVFRNSKIGSKKAKKIDLIPGRPHQPAARSCVTSHKLHGAGFRT